MLGNANTAGGHPIYLWNGAGWEPEPGGAETLAVGPNGTPWVTNNADQIYQPN